MGAPYVSGALAHGALLDALLGVDDVYDALHENAGRDDMIRIELPRLDQMLDLGDGDLPGGRHDRIEVARGLAVDEIAFGVAHEGMDDREIGEEAALHHVFFA